MRCSGAMHRNSSPSHGVGLMLLHMRAGANGKVNDSFTSMHEVPLHLGKGQRTSHELQSPPEAVLREIDAQELNRMFVRRSGRTRALRLAL